MRHAHGFCDSEIELIQEKRYWRVQFTNLLNQLRDISDSCDPVKSSVILPRQIMRVSSRDYSE